MRSRLDRSEVKMLAICYLEEEHSKDGAKALRQGYVGEQQGWGEQRGEQ